MANNRITAKERNLLKGAVRRVFSRSDLRRKVVDSVRIDYNDPTRPRVKKWSRCPVCLQPTPTYLIQVDHVDPIIPTETTLEAMSWDTVIDRVWCEERGLQPICPSCHYQKTSLENKLRAKARKERKGKK